jgi:hypothetical protein
MPKIAKLAADKACPIDRDWTAAAIVSAHMAAKNTSQKMLQRRSLTSGDELSIR